MFKKKIDKLIKSWKGLNFKRKATIIGASSLLVVGMAVGVYLSFIGEDSNQPKVVNNDTNNKITVSNKSEEAKKLAESKKKAEELKKKAEEDKKKAEESKKELEDKLKNTTSDKEKEEIKSQIAEKENIISQSVETIRQTNNKIAEVNRQSSTIVNNISNNVGNNTPNRPEIPKVTVVSSNTEYKSENGNYTNYSYSVVEDNSKAKGTSGIKSEGKQGYTTYKYSRTVTKYSDGSVKYGDWVEVSRNVVDPVNGVKWVGTYVEPVRTGGYFSAEGEAQMAKAINKARREAGLKEVAVKYNNWVAESIGTEGYGHRSTFDECVGYNSSIDGETMVLAWLSDSHKQSILNPKTSKISVGCYVVSEDEVYYAYSALE